MACWEARYAVRGDSVAETVCECAAAVGVFAREVEEVHARKNDEEAAEEGDCVHSIGCVESAEEEEGRNEGAGREGYVV